MLQTIICEYCEKVFSPKNRNWKQKYCSKSCAGKNNKKGLFEKGQKAWNKGLIGYRKGYKMTEEQKRKIGEANSQNKSAMWKGDNVGYDALHDWVQKYKKRPVCCEFCGKKGCRFEWANKSGEYKRAMDDWINLCCSCHKKFDNTGQKAILINKLKQV